MKFEHIRHFLFFLFRDQPSSVNGEQNADRGYTSEHQSIMECGESSSNFSMQPSTMVSAPLMPSVVSAASTPAQSVDPCGDQHTEGEALPWGAEVIHQDTFESQSEISTFIPLACSSPKPKAPQGEEAEAPAENNKSEQAFIFENSITGQQKEVHRVSKRRRLGRRAPPTFSAGRPLSRPRRRGVEYTEPDEGGWEQQKESFNKVIENPFIFFLIKEKRLDTVKN